MENIKINALLNYLGESKETATVETLKHDDDKTIFIDNMEYIILTDEEADEQYKEYQLSLIEDLGLEGFSDWAKNYILDNFTFSYSETFNDIQYEDAVSYVGDLKYDGDLDDELSRYGCENEEELIDLLCEEDSEEWFKSVFGIDEYNRIIIENDLIDWDEVIEWIKEVDGRGIMASYDGIEMELENDLYGYRIG